MDAMLSPALNLNGRVASLTIALSNLPYDIRPSKLLTYGRFIVACGGAIPQFLRKIRGAHFIRLFLSFFHN